MSWSAEGEHQENVHNALYAELAKGLLLPATRENFKAAITDLVQRGAQAVILACTEFGMLIEAKDSPVPLIDTTVAHAEAAVDWHCNIEPPPDARILSSHTTTLTANGGARTRTWPATTECSDKPPALTSLATRLSHRSAYGRSDGDTPRRTSRAPAKAHANVGRGIAEIAT